MRCWSAGLPTVMRTYCAIQRYSTSGRECLPFQGFIQSFGLWASFGENKIPGAGTISQPRALIPAINSARAARVFWIRSA